MIRFIACRLGSLSRITPLCPSILSVSYGRFVGSYTLAGRLVALASLAFLVVTVAIFVRQFAGQWRLGIYAALLIALALAVFSPDRVAMNDPELLSLAWSFVGFYLYANYLQDIGNRRSRTFLCACAMVFAISLFIKHTSLAFPAIVGLHLLFERAWKPLALWLGTLAALSAALLGLTFWWDGPYFFSHLLSPRTYSLLSAGRRAAPYLLDFQILIAASALWSILYATWPVRNLLVGAFVLSHLLGFAFAGGFGVDENVLFDALITLVVITAIAIGDLECQLLGLRCGNLLLFLALTIPSLGILALLPGTLMDGRDANRQRLRLNTEYRRAVEILRSRPGPALCEDLLLCYDAGKPALYDPYYATSQVRVGRLSERDLLSVIVGSRFATIELNIPAEESLVPISRIRFSQPVMEAILERYRPVTRGPDFAILIPEEEH